MDNKTPFAPDFEELPRTLPIFPLLGVLLLPGGQLPLNIFEPRYLAMIDDALAGDRMIGLVQPKPGQEDDIFTPEVYETGCAGKITIFNEMPDGRYEIKLNGICRFDIKKEIRQRKHEYRVVKPSWSVYETDLSQSGCLKLDRTKLKILLGKYFENEGMECDWQAIDSAPDNKLITCLSMACPFEESEKQALLEAPCCKTRSEMFLKVLEMAVCSKICDSQH